MRTFCKLLFAALLTTCMACAHNQKISLETNQIAEGIQTGAPALPYFVYSEMSLLNLNEEFKSSNTLITIEDTYEAAYKFSLNDIPADGNTDQVFDNMQAASKFLQQIMQSRGVDHSEKYFLTAIDTTNDDRYLLLAAVFRPERTINVFNKYDFLLRQTLNPEDLDFYRAYRTDVSGKFQDVIYEWAAVPLDCISTQKNQAILLTLIANAILKQKADNNYWREERQWIAGNHLSVLVKQDMKVSQMMGLEKSFTRQQEIYNSQ